MKSYLLVIGEVEALKWILDTRQMAFPPTRAAEALQLDLDDELFLYTTRGAFHNPTRDRGRVIGIARVSQEPRRLSRPQRIVDREFTTICGIQINSLAEFRDGVELAPLVPELELFPDPRSWSARLRRTLVRLSRRDAALLRRRLKPLVSSADRSMLECLAR